MLDQQLQIEQDMAHEARARLKNDNQKTIKRTAWSESKLGRMYTVQATQKFVNFLQTKFNNYSTEFASSNVRGLKLMVESGLDAPTICYLFTKALFNQMPLVHRRRLKRVTLCKKAGDLIHDEMRIKFFASADNRRNLLKKLFATFDKRTYPREWRKRTIKNYFYAEQLEWSKWSDREKLVVGYTLLVWFRDCTRLVDAPRTSKWVDPSPALLEHVQKMAQARELDLMLYKPMTVKPLPWTPDNMFRGGYLSDNVKTYPLVKGSSAKDVDRMQSRDWSNILPAINALQETPWRVNQRMLDVLKWAMYEQGGNLAGLPPSNDKPLPAAPVGYKVDDAITKAHNKVCFLIHSENRENISKRLLVFATITVAQMFKGYDVIYFPHNLDSRGRAYPVPVFLQPQGPDYCKAMLEFANGMSIDNEDHACWLAIAGANAYGKDKISLQERVNWVQDNDELIFSIARDPKHDLRWMEAAEPFQFLRFCFEWFAFWEHGYGYKSHMVVPVDATCSGLQHYSAMLRDEVGGRSVNLVPGIDRQDIYQDVADRAIELLMVDDTDEARSLIKFGIDRKITKRQVMVVPYAGTFASCMNYTREAINEKLKDGNVKLWSDEADNAHAVKLAQAIWQAIQDVVLKGREAMEWLSGLAREYSKHVNKQAVSGNAYDKRMYWTTPDGFEVVHFRPDHKEARVDTYLDGRVSLTYYKDVKTLSPSDMALAVAPNFVHSMDANLLRASIIQALDKGITEFAMVHDSFGVHASEMSVFLHQCVKPAFVDMYQKDVLQEFTSTLPADMDIPAKPERGCLVLEDVKNSEFFFS